MVSAPSLRERIRSVSLIFACGTALFSDGYANTVIGSVNTLLTRIYGQQALADHNYSTIVNSTGFAGTVVGMLLFGLLSDKIGRKFGMMSAATIVILFSGLSAASSGANGSVGGLLSMLSAMRFFLGIGVGAEYPCGSVAASEQSEEPVISHHARHRWLGLATVSTLVFGFAIASFVPWVLYLIFGLNHLRAVWRLSLGLGVVPALAVLLWRLNMDEPMRYKSDSMKNTRIPYKLVFKRYWRSLMAISVVWFVLDIIVYRYPVRCARYVADSIFLILSQFSIYSSTILNNITGGSQDLKIIFGWNTVINLFYFPGQYQYNIARYDSAWSLILSSVFIGAVTGSLVVDYLGPKYTLTIGFLLQALIGFIISGLYVPLTHHIAAFSTLYGLFDSFSQFGAGLCTFILASKACPTAVRGQYFGVAAASGKLGAFIGIWIFPPIVKAFGGSETVKGNTGPFWIASGLCVFGALVSILFVHPLTPEGIAREDCEFRKYLEAHGYDTSRMGFIRSLPEETSSEDKKRDSDVDRKVVEKV
ncbi:putative metabolite transport protein [Termitomyces sp. J132]|nr:putative metabolite transport protein [Termitomyces sp. J132]